jgi:hypothetical protein
MMVKHLMFCAYAIVLMHGMTAMADPAPAKQPSLDDELLQGLGPDPADEIKPSKPATKDPKGASPANKPSETKPAEKKSTTTEPAKPATRDSLDDELLKGLGDESGPAAGETTEADGDNPLVSLNRKMREAERLMRAAKGDTETQDLQTQIVRKLEELIDELEQQQQQQQSSSSSSKNQKQQQQKTADQRPQSQPQMKPGGPAREKPSSDPARDSSGKTVKRETEKPDMARMREMLKDIWGELPPRLRQEMMQSSVEKFIPKYELLIEEYFKALAEKQRNGSAP